MRTILFTASLLTFGAVAAGCTATGPTSPSAAPPAAATSPAAAASAAAAASPQPAGGGGAPTVATASAGTLGTILTDGHGVTLYLFEKDTPSHSNCTGPCAE
ncbi:MAG TPA: hypothetical protein VH008_01320, partial [Pseudonocardia sp.]|nr:hypothetical protein [Pseudonocardia sp.]